MIVIEDYVELAVRGLKVYFHESEERLLEAARGDKAENLEATSVLKKKRREESLRLGEESFTWSVLETN